MAVGRFAPSVQPSVRRFRAGNAGQPDRPPGFLSGSQRHLAERQFHQRAVAARRGAHPHRQRAGGRQQRRIHHECFTGGKTQHAAGLRLRNRPAAAVCGFDPQLRRGDFGGEIKFRFRHERLGSRVADLRQRGCGNEGQGRREHRQCFFHDMDSFVVSAEVPVVFQHRIPGGEGEAVRAVDRAEKRHRCPGDIAICMRSPVTWPSTQSTFALPP